VDRDLATAMRNTALAAVAALLLGLVGAVLGAWMSSGEPMTFTHYRRRDLAVEDRPRRAA
jgi:ABC-type sulfate transport system permease component